MMTYCCHGRVGITSADPRDLERRVAANVRGEVPTLTLGGEQIGVVLLDRGTAVFVEAAPQEFDAEELLLGVEAHGLEVGRLDRGHLHVTLLTPDRRGLA